MFDASRAVTVKLSAIPAVVVVGVPEITKFVAPAAPTLIALDAPVIDAVTVSVAVMVREPAVLSVAPLVKMWTPLSPAVNV